MKQNDLDQYFHLTQYTMKQNFLDQHLYTSPTRCYCQKSKMAIYIKSTILKLENSRNMLEIVFFVYTEHAKFQKASFNSNWDVMQWNKIFWIDTLTSPSTFLCYNFSFGSIPSCHRIHSCAIILVFGSIPPPQQVHSCAVKLKWP